MKPVFVVASLLLLCAAAFAVEVQTSSQAMVASELQFTLESVSAESETQALVSQLTAQAEVAHASHARNGVQRLIGLIRKVLDRLLRQIKRRSARDAKNRKACALAIKQDRAIVKGDRSRLKAKRVKLGIAQNVVLTSGHEATRLKRKAADHSQAAEREEARMKAARVDYEVRVARVQRANEETAALIKLLKLIDAKLTANGLAEIQAQLTQAAASASSAHATAKAEVASMLELAAEKARAGDVQDVHDMLALLIRQLESEMRQNDELLATEAKVLKESEAASTQSVDAERANAKLAVKQQDEAVAAGDKARARILLLQREIASLQANIKSTRAHLKSVRSKCRFEQTMVARKQRAARKQIRVLRQVIAMLQRRQLSKQVSAMIKDVQLDLPLWRKGAWSSCSKACGVGMQTREVSCEADRCLGFKPRTKRMCRQAPCKSDCVLTAWSAWTPCSKRCGSGGVKQRTRKVLALAVNGGKACPSSRGLIQKRACNQRECTAQDNAAVDEFAADKTAAVAAAASGAVVARDAITSSSSSSSSSASSSSSSSDSSSSSSRRRRLRRKLRSLSREARKLRKGLRSAVYRALGKADRQAARRKLGLLQRRINKVRVKLGLKPRNWAKRAKLTIPQRIAKLNKRGNKLRALIKKLKTGIKSGEYSALGKRELAKAKRRLARAQRRLRRNRRSVRALKARLAKGKRSARSGKGKGKGRKGKGKAVIRRGKKVARRGNKFAASASSSSSSAAASSSSNNGNGGRGGRRGKKRSLRGLVRRLRKVRRSIKSLRKALKDGVFKSLSIRERRKAQRKLKQLQKRARSLKRKIVRRRNALRRRFGKLQKRANKLKRNIRNLKRGLKSGVYRQVDGAAGVAKARARLQRSQHRLRGVQIKMRRVGGALKIARRAVGRAGPVKVGRSAARQARQARGRAAAPARGRAAAPAGGRGGGRRPNIIRRAVRSAGRAVRSVGRAFRRRG